MRSITIVMCYLEQHIFSQSDDTEKVEILRAYVQTAIEQNDEMLRSLMEYCQPFIELDPDPKSASSNLLQLKREDLCPKVADLETFKTEFGFIYGLLQTIEKVAEWHPLGAGFHKYASGLSATAAAVNQAVSIIFDSASQLGPLNNISLQTNMLKDSFSIDVINVWYDLERKASLLLTESDILTVPNMNTRRPTAC
jgi:hypothetical protein